MLVKAQLVSKISEIIEERGYSQTEAAQHLGLPQPKLSKLMRGQFRGVPTARITPPSTTTFVSGMTDVPSNTRTCSTISGFCAG
jgi:hypothetical protein